MTLIELRPIKIQNGIRKVVNKIKNNEIPSIPKYISMLAKGIQPNLYTNWNFVVNLSKWIHKKVDTIKFINETFKAILCWYLAMLTAGAGPNINIEIPHSGIIIRHKSKDSKKMLTLIIVRFDYYICFCCAHSPSYKQNAEGTQFIQ